MKELHSVMKLEEAIQRRMALIKTLLEENLGKKRKMIIAQMQKLDENKAIVQKNASVVRKDIVIEFDGILERLSSSFLQLNSILAKEIATLQRKVIEIEELIAHFKLTRSKSNIIPFLGMYHHLNSNAEELLVFQFKSMYSLPFSFWAIFLKYLTQIGSVY